METEELLDYQKPLLKDVMLRNVLMGESTCVTHGKEDTSGTGTEVPTYPDDPEP